MTEFFAGLFAGMLLVDLIWFLCATLSRNP